MRGIWNFCDIRYLRFMFDESDTDGAREEGFLCNLVSYKSLGRPRKIWNDAVMECW